MVPQQGGALGRSQSGVAGGAVAVPYPDRFFAAALYAGFAPASPLTPKSSSINLSDDTALLLYALHQQATAGPCNVAKPWSWNVVEYAKWTSWNQLAKMPSTEAMRLFVRTLEEEDPDWLRKVQDEKIASGDQIPEWWAKAHDEETSTSTESTSILDGTSNHTLPAAGDSNSEETDKPNSQKVDHTLPSEAIPTTSNGTAPLNEHEKMQEQDIRANQPDTVGLYNHWFSPPVLGRRPAARYQHAAAVVGRKMFVIGGNHNGRYLSDVQELDLDTLTWSKVEQEINSSASAKQSTMPFPPCAGHSLIHVDGKLLTVAGHSKEFSDSVTVRSFDTDKSSWSIVPSYGNAPIARGGQTVTKVGNTLIMFGGEDSKRRLHNDLNILDLETMTWDTIEAGGIPPSPRSDHAAAVHDDRFLFVFGGGSHSTCFNDLHILDIEQMEWSQPQQQGFIPSARAGHAAVTIGENWYMIGGGDNKSGISDTLVLNMRTLAWHVIATEQGRTPIASEGLSVVEASVHGLESLISFGGYNGRYSNEVHLFRVSPVEKKKLKVFHSAAAAAAAASAAAAVAVARSQAELSTASLNGDHIPEDTEAILSLEEPQELELELEETRLQDVEDSSKDETVNEVDTPYIDEKRSVTTQLELELEEAQSEAEKFKRELAVALQENSDLEKELIAVRDQLAGEQSRCFRLEVDIAELRQKLQAMDSLEKEADLLRRQKAASEEAAVNAAQKPSTGVWSWLAGHDPLDHKSVEV